MTPDLTKPVQTADGRKARVICTDRGGTYPVVVLVARDDGAELVRRYDLLGRHVFERDLDLINIDTTPKNLRIAREAVAQVWEEKGYSVAPQSYRTGVQDGCTEILAVLKALEMVA